MLIKKKDQTISISANNFNLTKFSDVRRLSSSKDKNQKIFKIIAQKRILLAGSKFSDSERTRDYVKTDSICISGVIQRSNLETGLNSGLR